MNKKLLSFTFLFALLFSGSAYSQVGTTEKCATMQVLEEHKKQDPTLQIRLNQAEQHARLWLKNHKNAKNLHKLTIPVVVHVIYNQNDSAEQNIPDSTVFSQIDVLNEDFRRLNADTVNTRPVFDSVAADTYIEFCMASVDPNGNPTNGITRTATTASFDPITEGMKADSTGGKDAWPAGDYLNIWVCDMSIFGQVFVLGYAQFPGDDPSTDGVVIQYQHFGTHNDSTAAPANRGRTTTHEVGHWLGLRHIWGDGDCDSIDFVYDTPNADAASQSNCALTKNTCSNDGPYWAGSDPYDMVENFMDYSADSCMNMFSKGQAERMWSFLFTDRLSLLSSPGCDSTAMNAFTTTQDISCGSSCDGWAKVSPFNGTPPYNYLWQPGSQTTDSIGGLCAGQYNVRITDAGGDTVNLNVNVGTADPMHIALTSVDAGCASCADGQATATYYGGTPPYAYQWNDPSSQITSTATGLLPGWYTVTVTDACGNSRQDSVEVMNGANAIAGHSEQADFSIFPNPADHSVRLTWNSEIEFSQLRLIDITGRALMQQSIGNDVNGTVLDVSDYDAGIYFVEVCSDTRDHVVQKKLLIQ